MQDARVLRAIIALCLLVLAGSGAAYILKSRAAAPTPIVITEPAAPPVAAPVSSAPAPPKSPSVISPAPNPKPAPKIFVHVAGAVKKPSLYALPVGCRVMQAITAAGGAKANADLDSVNLAEKLTDGEKVYLPVKSAMTPMLAPPGNAVGRASVGLEAPASKAAGKPTKTAPAKPGKLSAASPGIIALNTASADELERLPGIGPAMAARILAYRHAQGGFQKTDELMNVSGIGPKKFAKIESFVKLR